MSPFLLDRLKEIRYIFIIQIRIGLRKTANSHNLELEKDDFLGIQQLQI